MSKRPLKLCSILLIIAMLVNMLPMQVWGQALASTVKAPQETINIPITDGEDTQAEIIGEITEHRTEFSKEYLLSNGLRMAAVYPDAVHYETAEGWKEIDNTLVAKSDGTYRNKAGNWEVSFPGQLSANGYVTVEKDGYTLRFAMTGALHSNAEVMSTRSIPSTMSVKAAQSATAQIDTTDKVILSDYPEILRDTLTSRLSYKNVFENTSISYDLSSNTVKESVILEKYDSTLYGYRFDLNVGQMIPVLEEDGKITLYSADRKNVVMVMPAPFLVDEAMTYSYDVQVQLTGSGSRYTLTYILPQQWLASSERAWPVILDPVITANSVRTNIQDITVAENKSYSYNWGMNECGKQSPDGVSRTFFKYKALPELASSDIVLHASLQMCLCAGTSNAATIQTHKVLNTWDSTTMTWANQPAYDSTIEDYAIVQEKEKYYAWDITDVVRGWYEGENTGVLFRIGEGVESGSTTNYKQFYSSDYSQYRIPLLTIIFRNTKGLESYWDYTATSADRAGTGYIHNYTGNLVWIHEDIGFGGNRMPVSIQHIFNSHDAGTNTYGLGSGWRSNYNQRVYQWTQNTTYYVWEDSDGTNHYFKYASSNTYKDEDGLELTLYTSGTGNETYRIVDKGGNTSYFDAAGRLTKLENNQQTKSSITVEYTAADSNLISKITDGAGRVYTFSYTGGLLQTIRYLGSGTTEIDSLSFGYTGINLTSITEIDYAVCSFTYQDKGLIETVIERGVRRLAYTYTTEAAGKPSRVKTVTEYSGTVEGGKLTFEYAHNQTTIKDHDNNTEILQFNNMGNTVCIQDAEGHAQYTQYHKNSVDGNGKSNQFHVVSKLQNTVGNRLKDGNFEIGSYWGVGDYNATSEKVSTQSYIGNHSLLFTATQAACVNSESFTIEKGTTYTFSAYV